MNNANHHLPLLEINYKWLITGLLVIILGFMLMMGGKANTINDWNPEIFSVIRLNLAPLFVISGYSLVGFSIWKK